MRIRKPHDSTTVLIIMAILVIVWCVLLANRFSVGGFSGIGWHPAERRRALLLYHTDYEALLKAGREILHQGPKDPYNYIYLGPQHIEGFPVPRNVRIPKVIRKLRPHASLINRNGYVVLQMEEGIIGFGVKIYPAGFKAPHADFNYGNRQLLPGLWYYDDEYDNDPEYERKVNELIEKGKWEEPNGADLSKESG